MVTACAVGGTLTPHCARAGPGPAGPRPGRRQARGVQIHEQTPVTAIERGRVSTLHGTVRAEVVVQATEGYTPDLPGHHRDVVPMYSLMVATEALPEAFWAATGLGGRTTFSDKRHCASTGSARPTDGSPSAGVAPPTTTPREYDRSSTVTAGCTACSGGFLWTCSLRWRGPVHPRLGWEPRHPTGLVPVTRLRPAQRPSVRGRVRRDGVATANLAGRTLADLITGADGDLLDLPWLARRSPRWEPEPLRWLGVNAGTAVFALADRTEARTGRPSRLAPAFWRLLGH